MSRLKEIHKKTGFAKNPVFHDLVDLAGIEPASESLSTGASPITAIPFTFPRLCGERPPHNFSSFIIRLPAQSFAGIVSRNHDADCREYGYNRVDEQPLGRYCNCIVVSV